MLHPFLSQLFLLFVSLLIKFLVESNNLILALYDIFFRFANFAGIFMLERPDGPPRKACGKEMAKFRDENKWRENVTYVGCDHTSTKSPDPIRTPKLSVLGRE